MTPKVLQQEPEQKATNAEAQELQRWFDAPAYTGPRGNNGEQKKRGWFHRQRKKLIVGGLSISLMGYGGFMFFSGPFQIIHFSQLLTQFHFSNNEDVQDSRVVKTIRFLRYDRPELRRLG